MRSRLQVTNYALSFSFLFLLSCTPSAPSPTQTSLFLHRVDPPAFIEFSDEFKPVREIPFSVPPGCKLFDVFPAPAGTYLLIELSCPNGQTVLFLDTESSLNADTTSVTQPVTDSDAHFLAWTGDGRSVYLKVDSLGNARVIRAYIDGRHKDMDVTGWTYDLSARPDSNEVIFAFSRGLGSGSELHLTRNNGRTSELLYADPFNYISFARYSPDGTQVAFIKTPDSQTPFTVGELWVMDANGSNPRKLADADAGHGYAANWSPDGTRLAFVKRENVEDDVADQSADSLISNIYSVNVENGGLTQVTSLADGYAETPHWSPDGNILVFSAVLNGRMQVQVADTATGEVQSLIMESACCPAWLRR